LPIHLSIGEGTGMILIVDEIKCTGCRICELVCSMAKHRAYNPRGAYIRVLTNREMDMNVVALKIACDFCGECIEGCPTKALKFVSFEQAAIIRKENNSGIRIAPVVE